MTTLEIDARCSVCLATFKVLPIDVGQSVQCPECGHTITAEISSSVVHLESLTYQERILIYQYHHQQSVDAARQRHRILGYAMIGFSLFPILNGDTVMIALGAWMLFSGIEKVTS